MSVGGGEWRGMEVKMKAWCCSLNTAVGVVGGGMAALYLVVGVMAVGWGVLHKIITNQGLGSVIEVDSFDEAYGDVARFEERDDTLIFLAVALVISFLGILSSLVLVVGVLRRSSRCLLPWLVLHVVMILGCIGSGVYLVIYFLVLVEERAVDMAVVSAGQVLAGIFLIFLWVLVDQLYIQLKQTKVTIEVENPLRKSISNLNMMNKHNSSTLRSCRSNRSQLSTRSLRSVKKRRNQNRQKELKRKSRSLEHILDSSSISSNSTYQSEIISRKLEGLTTLPRLRRCQENPNTFRAYMDCDSYYGNTDTIRSCRSIASVKSVAIHPQVTKYHYSEGKDKEYVESGRAEWEDGLTIEFSEEADDSLDEAQKPTESIISLPTPIYPSVDRKHSWKSMFSENKKSFTKDQIIDFYCPNDVNRQ
jgi:hypothetical protein